MNSKIKYLNFFSLFFIFFNLSLYGDNIVKQDQQLALYILYIGGMFMLALTLYAITLRKKHIKIQQAHDNLDQKIQQEVQKNIEKEKLLIQQSRTAAMGEMLGAIIHQWKQPLNGISISNSAIDLHIKMDDFDKELLSLQTETISKQIEYMDKTLNDFRDFFKLQPKSCFHIDKAITDVLKLVGRVYRSQNINIILDIEKNLTTYGYPNEFSQVIINILNNSRDAIQENKRSLKDVIIKGYKDGDKIKITISDLAGGIPEYIIDKIFDPYITTKSDDKGTGIGLDMSKNIIEKIGGKIEAQNISKLIDQQRYKGAQFNIELNYQECN